MSRRDLRSGRVEPFNVFLALLSGKDCSIVNTAMGKKSKRERLCS